MKKAVFCAVLCTGWVLTQGLSVVYAGTTNSGGMSKTTSASNSMKNMSGTMSNSANTSMANSALGLMKDAVTVKPVSNSKVAGTANLTVTSKGLNVVVQLSGLTPGTTYQPQIRFGETGADAGSGWALPSVKADSAGTASLTTNISGIVAIPEDGWYFRVDSASSMPGMSTKTVAMGTIGQTLPSDTSVATMTTSSYLISLQIGSIGRMITPAQAKAGESGDIMPMVGTSMSGMNMMSDGMPVNHHLEVHVFNRKTGAVENHITPMITTTNPATGKTSSVSAVAMYGSDVGMPDYHYGNNVDLAAGSYNVTVAIGSEKAQFEGVQVTGVHATSSIYVSPTGSDTSGQGTQASPYQTINHALSVAAAHSTIIVEPGTYKEMVNVTKPVTLESDTSVSML